MVQDRIRGSVAFGRIIGQDGNHLPIETTLDNRTVRVNSRNFVLTSGDGVGGQSKPNLSVGGTSPGPGLTGFESSPRFAAGIEGNSLVAFKGDPLLKAGSGAVNGQVTAFQANIDFGISGTRVITGDVSAFEGFLAVPSTYTYNGDVAFLRVRTVNIKQWDYFLNLDDANTGVATSVDPSLAGTETRWLRVREGSTSFWIKVFPAA